MKISYAKKRSRSRTLGTILQDCKFCIRKFYRLHFCGQLVSLDSIGVGIGFLNFSSDFKPASLDEYLSENKKSFSEEIKK